MYRRAYLAEALRYVGVISLIFVGFFLPSLAVAQEGVLPGGAFVLRPAKVELTIAPGGEEVTEIKLANGGATPLRVEVSFEDLGANPQRTVDDDPVKLVGRDGGVHALSEFFRTPKMSFDILSGKEVSVPVFVTVPRGIEPKGLYGAVVFTFRPAIDMTSTRNANVVTESRVASLFYVRVSGEVKEEGKLVQFGLFNDEKAVLSPTNDAPLRFQVAYENGGTVHLNPYGRLTLTPLIGSEQVIGIDPWAVLPGATRMREVDLREPLRIGRYTAHLELNRGYGDIVDEQKVVFWVIPGPEGFLVIILSVLFFVWLLRRSLSLSRHSIS
jgi:hypothetical protein